MESFALYLLKSAIWLSGFALVYFIFLKNERFFLLKRFYLVAGILISFIFPLFTFHYQVEMYGPSVGLTGITPYESADLQVVRPVLINKPLRFTHILLTVYLSGIIFLVFRSFRHIGELLKTINKCKVNNIARARLVRSSEFSGSFSFFNYVFINPSVDEKELDVIMNHELVHVTQKHWLDLLLVELLRLFQWVNPFAWFYAGFIRQNHEYIADEVALQHAPDPAVYKAVLINQLFDSRVISLSNSFNYSLNKKRFDMMKKIVTSPYRKLKILLVLPVFALIFYEFATPVYRHADPSDDPLKFDPALTLGTSENPVSQEQKANVKIRNSDGAQTRPLIVINGKISAKNVEDIDPSSIVSMSVLKDRSATDKYGEKGKDGVIEIITKDAYSKEPGTGLQSADSGQKTVKGIVVDGNGQPLSSVNITSTGTMGYASSYTTFQGGKFELNNIQPDATLLISCKGFKGLAIKADFSKEMQIVMEKDPDYREAAVQRPAPLVVIDGVISEIPYTEVSKTLGYDMGPVKSLMGKEATDKYGEKGARGVMEVTTRKKALEMGLKPPFPRFAPEDYPTFQNQRHSTFNYWVADHVIYPQEAKNAGLEGWVTVNFTVELDGTISSAVPGPGQPSSVLCTEVIRAVLSAPAWDPPRNPAVDMPFTSGITLGFKLPDRILREAPYVVVEQMPLYPGGEGELLKFIAENTKYPEAAKAEKAEGRVIIRFIVNTEGNTEGITVLKGIHPLLDTEAVRVVKMLSGFKPGMQGGNAVNVWYMVPVNFALPITNQP